MKITDEKNIQLDRELSDLDLLVLDFVRIVEKQAKYVLISGYVAILFGRSRTTEDVDMFIEPISPEKFHVLYEALCQKGFWALNADSEQELFSMLADKLAIRFAKRGMAIPNIEVKFARDFVDMLSFEEKMRVTTKRGDLWISNLALQIAYKKFALGTQKDLEDARHLQELFQMGEENINKYKEVLQRYGRC